MCLDLKDTRSSGYKTWMDAFGAAKAKWENIIVGDLPNIVGAGYGSSNCGPIPTNFDDMYLCGLAEPIDGSYGVLGSAGPWYIQTLPSGKKVTTVGSMRFDTADIDRMIAEGGDGWLSVIVHEAGHGKLFVA